jgi:hypothetical protein
MIKGMREGTRSRGQPVRISLKYLTPSKVRFACDTVNQAVTLRWSMPDTTLVKSFNIYRKNLNQAGESPARLNQMPLSDTLFTDSTVGNNQTYEYYVASLVKMRRAEVKSEPVEVLVADAAALRDQKKLLKLKTRFQ